MLYGTTTPARLSDPAMIDVSAIAMTRAEPAGTRIRKSLLVDQLVAITGVRESILHARIGFADHIGMVADRHRAGTGFFLGAPCVLRDDDAGGVDDSLAVRPRP